MITSFDILLQPERQKQEKKEYKEIFEIKSPETWQVLETLILP